MGRPPGRTFDGTINMRVDADTLARLDALVAQLVATGMGRSSVARACMVLGLAAAERDVRALLGAATPRRTR
jgi:hypothetical protein